MIPGRRRRLSVSTTQVPSETNDGHSTSFNSAHSHCTTTTAGKSNNSLTEDPVVIHKSVRRKTDHGDSLEADLARLVQARKSRMPMFRVPAANVPAVKVPSKFGGTRSLLSRFRSIYAGEFKSDSRSNIDLQNEVHSKDDNLKKDNSKDDNNSKAEENKKSVLPSLTDKRAVIKKYPNIDNLLNKGCPGQKNVSVGLVAGLIKNPCRSLLVFGDPSEAEQRGFDHKKLATAGTLASEDLSILEELNIGYSCKKGFKPESPNQDDFFVIVVDDWKLIGVFDGHGPYGHDVSGFVHRTLPFLLLADPEFETHTLESMKRNFLKVHELLESHCHIYRDFDCSLSGCTATILLIKDQHLYVAHVGDSRAIIGTAVPLTGPPEYKKIVYSFDLTIDHKPTLATEQDRIEASGGEVKRLRGDIPYRVFIKGKLYPGLAMSRAIGDSVGNMVGLTAEPDVSMRPLTEDDKYIIVATDGVWEFISSSEALEYFMTKEKQNQSLNSIATFIASEAWRRWIKEEEVVVDDITCVLIKL